MASVRSRTEAEFSAFTTGSRGSLGPASFCRATLGRLGCLVKETGGRVETESPPHLTSLRKKVLSRRARDVTLTVQETKEIEIKDLFYKCLSLIL